LQPDSTGIAIRERSLLDLLDLGLRVIRAHAWPLFATSAAGMLPFAFLNALLLQDFASRTDYINEVPAEYIWWMICLVMWEVPLASAPATLYLGQAMFRQRPEPGRIVRDLVGSLPQLLVFHGILRGLMMPLVITWIIPHTAWPFLNEIILLERNAMMRNKSQGLSTFRRSSALHSGTAGDQFGRFMTCLGAGVALVAGIWLTLWFIRIVMMNDRSFTRPIYTVLLPIAIWTVVGYFNVVRFLSYLDLRIRREGWEVELRMRAEGERLTRQLA